VFNPWLKWLFRVFELTALFRMKELNAVLG